MRGLLKTINDDEIIPTISGEKVVEIEFPVGPEKECKTGTTITNPTRRRIERQPDLIRTTHPTERTKRHISQNPYTQSAFYGPKGAWWRLVEQKYIATVSR